MSTRNLDDAVTTLMDTRDFCGDEHEALRDWEADNFKLTPAEKMSVWRMFELLWEKNQRDAGVTKPIDSYERARITKILNRS